MRRRALFTQVVVELAAGFARHDRRQRGPYTELYAIRLPTAAVSRAEREAIDRARNY